MDISPYNRMEMRVMYVKAESYGLPTISMYAASQGLGQAELDNMNLLETQVLKLPELFKPLVNSAQLSTKDSATDEGGAPQKDADELTDSGEQSREDGDDWG